MKDTKQELVLVDGGTQLCRRLLAENNLHVQTFEQFLLNSKSDQRTAGHAETLPATIKAIEVGLPVDPTIVEAVKTLRSAGLTAPLVLKWNGLQQSEQPSLKLPLGASLMPCGIAAPEKATSTRLPEKVTIQVEIEISVPQYHIGPISYMPSKGTFLNNKGVELSLTSTEDRLVRYLSERRGEVVSKRELAVNALGYHPAAKTHTIQSHIYRLRKKIRNTLTRRELILTTKNGYTLIK